MKEELQQALMGLEKDLKDIQSANEAVKEVRTRASKDIDAANMVVEKIRNQIDAIDVHFNNWLVGFDEETKGTFSEFERKMKEAVKNMAELNDSLKSQIDNRVDALSESNGLLFKKYETVWEKHNEELSRVFSKFEGLQQATNSMTSQVHQVDFPKRLDKIFSSIENIQQIQETQEKSLQAIEKKESLHFIVLSIMVAILIMVQIARYFI